MSTRSCQTIEGICIGYSGCLPTWHTKNMVRQRLWGKLLIYWSLIISCSLLLFFMQFVCVTYVATYLSCDVACIQYSTSKSVNLTPFQICFYPFKRVLHRYWNVTNLGPIWRHLFRRGVFSLRLSFIRRVVHTV